MGRRFFAAVLPLVAAVAIAWLIGLVPALGDRGYGPRDDISVFLSARPVRLADANLADWLSGLPRTMELKHAEWDGFTLMLDFRADVGELGEAEVYGALADMAVAGLAGTENVERLRIRVFDPYARPGKNRKLLLALEADRSAFTAGAHAAWQAGEMPPESWLSAHFRLSGKIR